MKQPLVSVVVSAFDRAEMLEISLASVLNQTLTEIEIIVQDDSTDDRCEEVVRKFNDPRIRYTHNRPPLGAAINLRSGYRKCRGKYFSTLNDDDFYAPNYLETMVSILEKNSAVSLAFCDHYVIDTTGKVLPEESDRSSDWWGRSKLREGIVPDPMHTTLIDKSVPGMFAVLRSRSIDLKDFPEEVSIGYDFWLTYLAVRDGGSIWYHPDRLTFYRVHQRSQTSLSQKPQARVRYTEHMKYIFLRLLADQRISSVWPDLAKRLAAMCANAGFAHLRLHERPQARKEFVASMKADPSRRAVAGIALSFLPSCVFRLLEPAQQSSPRS